MPIVTALKYQKRAIVERFHRSEDRKGYTQVATTLLPLAALWIGIAPSTSLSYGLTGAIVVLMTLLLVRVFVLMHECGHGSLFRSPRLNTAFGFVFGVVSGMPAYVWSRHHQYHHSTNGNWAKYRGPLNIIAVDEYAAMSASQQRRYRHSRAIWLAPVAGFLYLVFNPRINWLRGSAGLIAHVILQKMAQPGISIKDHTRGFKTSCWSSAREYRHMCWNNLALIGLWIAMAWLVGPLLFLTCHIISVSLAGGVGIMLFTVQHNFERSYASHDEGWDYHTAVIEGTSFLDLPGWLNWVTANIGYHHIHHLSARIPNYCLAACHDAYPNLFAGVTRITLWQIPSELKYILWDTRKRRIVSVTEFQAAAT